MHLRDVHILRDRKGILVLGPHRRHPGGKQILTEKIASGLLLLSNLAPIDASFNRLQPQTLLAWSPAPFAESNVVNVLWKLGLSLLALVVTQNFAKRAANERAAHPPVATLGCPCSPDLPQALRLLRFFLLPFWGICFLSVLCEGWPSLFAAMWKSGRTSWSRWPTDGCIHGRLVPNCVIWDLEFAQKFSCFFLTGWCIRRKNGGHDYILKSFILVQMAFCFLQNSTPASSRQ